MDLSAIILFPRQKWLFFSFFPSSSPHPSDTWGSTAITDDAPVTRMRDSAASEHWIVNDLLFFPAFSSFPPFFLSPSLAAFFPPSFPSSFLSFLIYHPDRRNALALTQRERNLGGIGSESIKLIVDGLMLQTTYRSELQLEVFLTFKETEMPFWFNLGES